jgi:hypothetical protein
MVGYTEEVGGSPDPLSGRDTIFEHVCYEPGDVVNTGCVGIYVLFGSVIHGVTSLLSLRWMVSCYYIMIERVLSICKKAAEEA